MNRTARSLARFVVGRVLGRLLAYAATAGAGFSIGLTPVEQSAAVAAVVAGLESMAHTERRRRRRENIRTRPGLVPPPENVADGPMPTRVHNLPPVDTARKEIV